MLHGENGAAPIRQASPDTTFEAHFSIGDLAKQWRLSRETVRLLIKDEPGVVKVRLGRAAKVHDAIQRARIGGPTGSHSAFQPNELTVSPGGASPTAPEFVFGGAKSSRLSRFHGARNRSQSAIFQFQVPAMPRATRVSASVQ